MKISNYWVAIMSLITLLGFTRCYNAQQATLATGNNIQSATGSVSYSVGQVSYQSLETSSGKVNPGVQQPYEIFSLSTNENETQKKITVYPNPVKDFLIVDFNTEKLEKASYQLSDGTGRLIGKGELQNLKSEINTSNLSSGMYILSIISGGKNMKTFKIIKK